MQITKHSTFKFQMSQAIKKISQMLIKKIRKGVFPKKILSLIKISLQGTILKVLIKQKHFLNCHTNFFFLVILIDSIVGFKKSEFYTYVKGHFGSNGDYIFFTVTVTKYLNFNTLFTLSLQARFTSQTHFFKHFVKKRYFLFNKNVKTLAKSVKPRE